jgi:hypothetical protein
VTSKHIWRVILVAALVVALATTAGAQLGKISGPIGPSAGPIIAGVVAVIATVVVIVIVLVVHKGSDQGTIAGCVKPGADRMSVIDDNDKRLYVLSGNTAGIHPRERLTVQGHKTKNGKTLIWETKKVTADLGVCQP